MSVMCGMHMISAFPISPEVENATPILDAEIVTTEIVPPVESKRNLYWNRRFDSNRERFWQIRWTAWQF